MCFGLLPVQCSGYGSLPRNVSPIVSDPRGSEMQSSLATRARHIKGVPCVGYAHPLALLGQWGKHGCGELVTGTRSIHSTSWLVEECKNCNASTSVSKTEGECKNGVPLFLRES